MKIVAVGRLYGNIITGVTVSGSMGAAQKLAHTYLEITDGFSRPEAVNIIEVTGPPICGRRPP